MPFRLAVINTEGEVWAREVTGSTVGAGVKLSGPGFFGGPDDKYVVGLRENIAVITQTGDVWNRKVTESTVGDGFNVGNIFGGPNDKYVLSDQKGTIFVVNTDVKCGYMVYRTTASAVGINLTVPDCLVGQMTNM